MHIPIALRQEILTHLDACLPQEGCGLLGGKEDRCERFLAIPNELHSPNGFRMDAQAQLQAFLQMEDLGLDLLAFFHSHPRGPQVPSATDVAEFAYPGVVSLICVPDNKNWIVRGFDIRSDQVMEISLIWEK
ncbi:predicted metal-dependent protease of the PAD1/JAB1 superfamily [Longilinea arvoryzae]|uniref:Predicted metal-dependent protease of the PAD1/JAB1 superfamily n=1 Tax=Longilinea arvoryzae TaxID=360412 RepID=A0A0S7BIF6_9CHLR|nr:M67 family metallopeptidase [Longilinea arvoryzae]GAP14104.1 predicted metal-dependent protease of the PAD1/JAB1 superfamily [Longilinea arvoryzae]